MRNRLPQDMFFILTASLLFLATPSVSATYDPDLTWRVLENPFVVSIGEEQLAEKWDTLWKKSLTR